MIAECLRDYIGLPDCGSTEPESGLYLTDQPGISLVSLDKVADSQKQTYKAVWEAIQTRSINRINSDVISAFAKRYHLKRLTESVKIREVISAANDTPALAEYRGINIELAIIGDTNYGRSGLQVVHVQYIRFYSQANINNVTFIVFDIDTLRSLENLTVDLVAGWNTIATNKNYLTYNVFIGYDSTLIDSVELLITDDDSGCCECGDTYGCGAKIQGAIYDANTQALTTGTNTFGLAGTYAVQCSYETIICNNKHLFKNAFFNCLAYELMRERVYTERINAFTTVNRDIAKNEMMPEFMNQYQAELQQVIDGIDLNPSDCCLVCDAVVQYVETKVI